MATFESKVKQIPYPQLLVFQTLGNLENIEKVRSMLPEDKMQNMQFTRDSLTLSVPPAGTITLNIVSRTEPKEIKFETAASPVPFNLWVQILPTSETSCKMKLTIKAELNFFIKSMVEKPLQEALERIADALAVLPYHIFQEN